MSRKKLHRMLEVLSTAGVSRMAEPQVESAASQYLRRWQSALGIVATLEDALTLIGRHGCDHLTSGHCAQAGKVRGAKYGADQWCDACIANTALGRSCDPRDHREASA